MQNHWTEKTEVNIEILHELKEFWKEFFNLICFFIIV